LRLFIGIELDGQVRDTAAAIAESLRIQLGRDIDARWIPAANLHITLWFIGEVADDRVDALLRAIDLPFEEASFDIDVAGLGAFPKSGAPRVIWIGVLSGAERLVRLHAELAARLRPFGIEPERRGYSAHLTIARVKDAPGGGRDGHLRAALRATPAVAGQSRVAAVTIFRSRLSPKGAAYEALLRVPLQ
jgi:2'-5' RNA ligase